MCDNCSKYINKTRFCLECGSILESEKNASEEKEEKCFKHAMEEEEVNQIANEGINIQNS